MARHRAPFGYPGGKTRALNWIRPLVPAHTHYVEPFCGSASVFFANSDPAPTSHLNDVNPDLMATLRFIRDAPGKLLGAVDEWPVEREHHRYIRDRFEPATELERAARWFYLIKTSYGCLVDTPSQKGTFFDRRDRHRWAFRVDRAHQQLLVGRTTLTCTDFEQVIDLAPDGAFLFVDPPYFYDDGHDGGVFRCQIEKADHDRLAACLHRNRARVRFLLTYGAHPYIRRLYSWATVRSRECSLEVRRLRADPRKTRELYIRNYRAPRRRKARS